VAEVLGLEGQRVSVEMVYRGLYHYVMARGQGYEGSAAGYLAQEAKRLGIVKRARGGMDLAQEVRRALVLNIPPPALTDEPNA
jgi:hypothetical protein